MKLIRLMDAADRVLRYFERLIPKGIEDDRLFLDTFKNGRERGYAIRYFGPDHRYGVGDDERQVVVTEERNSDAVLVYYGTINEFDLDNHPLEYQRYVRVAPTVDGRKRAARFIRDYLFKGETNFNHVAKFGA